MLKYIKSTCKKVLLFFVVFVSYTIFSQEPEKISNNYLLFEDAKTKEPVIIVNDTLGYRGFNFEKSFKTKFPENENLIDFQDYVFQIDSINYFVDRGCGVVLKFENDTFSRIDNSFSHKNQFFAVPFTHNKTIHLWGGYGFFIYKNFTTYFDFNSFEWFLKKTKNKKDISPRAKAYYFKTENNLYVFGGDFDYYSSANIGYEKDPYLNCLDLNTFTWKKEQRLNPIILDIKKNNFIEHKNQFQYNNKHVIISDKIIEIDFFKETLNIYDYKNYKNIYRIIYHASTNSLSFTYLTNDEFYIDNISYDDFKGNLISEEPLFVEETSMVVVYIVLVTLIIILFIYLVFKGYKKYKAKKNELIYFVKKDIFTTYKNEVLNLNSLNKEVLKIFSTQKTSFFELQTLNDALSKDINSNNYVTINKRRERVIKDLKFELSNILNIPKENVFSTRNSKKDKRIKEIKLNITIKVK